ncbi:MAG TPA: DUF3014 domain-containing protein [Steroidobacteraceae bacterium]|nr:DUF3014 domain-containing protein [Steroidobacteraceae bacterium]
MTTDKPIVWGAAAAVLVGAALLYYYYYARETVPVAAPAHQTHQPAPPPSEPAIEHPVPPPPAQGASQAPLPALNDSDTSMRSALTALPDSAALEKFIVPQNLIRHVVATIDNLPRKKVAVEVRPIAATPGEFAVAGTADHLTLSPDNFKRYTPLVDLVKGLDVKPLAAVYFRFYPLFQQAYEDLGYPTEYFNDRVIEVIDHLLETPDVPGPIELVQPNVMYLYADPKLEALSAGQKTLIRMGSDNAAVIKGKLRELRALLATHATPRAPAGTPPVGSAPSGAAQPPPAPE